eukprot:gene16985-biopygen11350
MRGRALSWWSSKPMQIRTGTAAQYRGLGKSSWLSSFGAELDGCLGRCRIRRRWICRVTELEWTRGFVGKLPWRDGTVCWNLGRREATDTLR